MQTLQDETTTSDDGTAFSAETPVEYTVGKIDSGDTEPWYISHDLMEHIRSGALRTAGWTRVTDSNTGIIIVPGSNVDVVVGDQGLDITGGVSGLGTLLEIIESANGDYLVIRPDGAAAVNDFVTASQTLTVNGHTFTQWATASSTTGDQIWANLYSIGTIDSNVHLYLAQGPVDTDGARVRLSSWNDATQDWYANGHIDICVALKNIESTVWDIIDEGFVSVFARKSGDLYASFEAANSITSGGRNPVPLQTAVDLDNPTGIKKELTGAWSTLFINGEIISAPSGARGIVDFANSLDDTHLVYHPIDDPQVDFVNAELITGATSGCTATSSGTPAAFGPADPTWFSGTGAPTVVFGEQQFDIDNDSVDEQYCLLIDVNNNRLSEVYEWCKYVTRNGAQSAGLDGINGEQYLGGEVYLKYDTTVLAGGTFAEGDDITQEGTLATGVVVSLDTTSRTILLRNTRGTFETGGASDRTITSNDGSGAYEMNSADGALAQTFAPKTASPLGTFAGGTFFGARGVLLTDWNSLDENLFILTAIPGGTYRRPASIQLTVTNLEGGAETSAEHDRVGIFRLLAGVIERDEYAISGTPAAGDPSITVGTAIATDTPASGSLIIVDSPGAAGAKEYKVRYTSWATSTFTLANATGTADNTSGTTSDTELWDETATFLTTAKRGDLVYTAIGIGYVKTVNTDKNVTLEGLGISGLLSGQAYELNAVPVALTSADDLYVPFMDKIATGSSESVSIIYDAPIDFRVKVRNTRSQSAIGPIKPYSSDGSSAGTNQSIPVVRTPDTVISTV